MLGIVELHRGWRRLRLKPDPVKRHIPGPCLQKNIRHRGGGDEVGRDVPVGAIQAFVNEVRRSGGQVVHTE